MKLKDKLISIVVILAIFFWLIYLYSNKKDISLKAIQEHGHTLNGNLI